MSNSIRPSNLNEPGVMILDARGPKFYTGEDVGSMPRGGHIPGAKSLPFSSLVDDPSNKFKSPEALRALLNTAGVKVSRPRRADTHHPASHLLHIGQQASLLYFVAR